MNTEEKIIKARINLILKSPFFGSLIMHLKSEVDDTCETIWTDGSRIGYSEKFVNGLTSNELTGVLAHEVMHCALQHMARRGLRDPIIWNMAGDYAVNLIVIKEFILPKERLLDDKYNDKSVDEIYNILYKETKNQSTNKSGKDKVGQGSKVTINSDPGGCGEVRDSSITDKSESERKWKTAVIQAVNNAKKAGNLPGDITRLVKDIVHPKIDWRQLLRRFIEMTAKNDYSWLRPNKRYSGTGIYLPSLYSEELRNIVIAIDTSGSIGDNEMNQFSTELKEIIREFKLDVDVIYCDTKIQSTQHFNAYEELKLKPKGGGGTKFSPMFKYINEKGLHPKCLIYLTDLESSDFPKVQPDYPTLWIKTGSHGETPPFGEVINLN